MGASQGVVPVGGRPPGFTEDFPRCENFAMSHFRSIPQMQHMSDFCKRTRRLIKLHRQKHMSGGSRAFRKRICDRYRTRSPEVRVPQLVFPVCSFREHVCRRKRALRDCSESRRTDVYCADAGDGLKTGIRTSRKTGDAQLQERSGLLDFRVGRRLGATAHDDVANFD